MKNMQINSSSLLRGACDRLGKLSNDDLAKRNYICKHYDNHLSFTLCKRSF